jgi:hypothetical protein
MRLRVEGWELKITQAPVTSFHGSSKCFEQSFARGIVCPDAWSGSLNRLKFLVF